MSSPLECPACNYVRKPTDGGPFSECPSCKIVFSKIKKQTQPASTQPQTKEVTHTSPTSIAPESNTNQRTKGEHEKFCLECGEIIRAKAEICPKCGVRQMSPSNAMGATTANGRNRTSAAIFAIILGGLGVHKFYLGQTGQGILYLLFCMTLIPAILGLIEGVQLLTMSDADFLEKFSA